MLTSLVEELIRRDLMLSAMRAVDTRRYIVSSWNRTPLMKMLWRSFSVMRTRVVLPMSRELLPGSVGKRCSPVMKGWCSGFCCGRRCPVWGSCPGWRSTAGCFCRRTAPFGKGGIAPLNGLCGAVCPPWGSGKAPVPSGFPDGFGPIPGSALGLNRRKDEKQEKALTLLCVRAGTTSRSAGGFRGSELTLFPCSKGDLDADIGKKPPNPAV